MDVDKRVMDLDNGVIDLNRIRLGVKMVRAIYNAEGIEKDKQIFISFTDRKG